MNKDLIMVMYSRGALSVFLKLNYGISNYILQAIIVRKCYPEDCFVILILYESD